MKHFPPACKAGTLAGHFIHNHMNVTLTGLGACSATFSRPFARGTHSRPGYQAFSSLAGSKPAARPKEKKTPGTVAVEKYRPRMNRLTDAERERLLAQAMVTIASDGWTSA